jgi:hypothetical protein
MPIESIMVAGAGPMTRQESHYQQAGQPVPSTFASPSMDEGFISDPNPEDPLAFEMDYSRQRITSQMSVRCHSHKKLAFFTCYEVGTEV